MNTFRTAGVLAAGAALAMMVLAPEAGAYEEPYYARVFNWAYNGTIGPGGTGATQIEEGPRAVSGDIGPRWWDCGTACAFGPGAGLGYSASSADPFAGVIRAESGARSLANSVVEWDVTTPFGTFHIVPPYWGEGQSEAYVHSTWRIASPDGSLRPGDPVSVTGTLTLSGVVANGPAASYKAALALTERTNAGWLAGSEFTDIGVLEDLAGRGQTEGFVLVEGDDPAGLPRSVEFTLEFHVGDELVMELLLRTMAGVPNDGIPKEVWARFGQTLAGGIATGTPGAVLVPIPEPGTYAMLLAGLGVVAVRWFGVRRGRSISSGAVGGDG